MKKYLLAMLVMSISVPQGHLVFAGDKIVLLTDSISAADTTAVTVGAVRADTAYSDVFKIQGATRIQFFIDMIGLGNNDTNWVDDTFWIDIQHSFDKTNWRLFLVDTLLANGVGWSKLNATAADSIIGDYARVRFIHWDSLDLNGDYTGLFENVYKKKLTFYYSIKK